MKCCNWLENWLLFFFCWRLAFHGANCSFWDFFAPKLKWWIISCKHTCHELELIRLNTWWLWLDKQQIIYHLWAKNGPQWIKTFYFRPIIIGNLAPNLVTSSKPTHQNHSDNKANQMNPSYVKLCNKASYNCKIW